MAEAVVPTGALVVAEQEEFHRHLPEGWFVRGWQVAIGFNWPTIPVLQVELWHHRGARVDLTIEARPDWDWLTAYLCAIAVMPFGLRADADRRS